MRGVSGEVTRSFRLRFLTSCSLTSSSMRRAWNKFQWAQVIMPLVPIPLGGWFLYKALTSFNRSPPPIATDSKTVLSRPLYAEPVYKSISYSPTTIARNMTSRGP